MKSILEDLFFGEIKPQSIGCSEHMSELSELIISNKEKLLNLLEGKGKAILHNLMDIQDEMNTEIALSNFLYGFKLGASITAEAIINC